MTRAAVVSTLALAALTLLGFFWFPGHTWLQQDTQIYVAILEHLRDPSTLARDIVATRPHVSYTVFDEIALALPFDLKTVLQAQQALFRLCALAGVFLVALRLLHDQWKALLVAAIFGLGAAIRGPEVLLLEYEPVPRGFAVNLLFLALGLVAWEKWWWTGIAAGLAFLYHPPTAMPFLAVGVFAWLVARRLPDAEHLLIPLGAAIIVLFLAAKFQRGEREAQHLFEFIDPDLEKLQRMRANYSWLSMWQPYWWWHYPIYGAISLGALWRLRKEIPKPLALFGDGLTLFGLLMLPVSWVLQETLKWSAMSSYQPARAVLLCSSLAIVFGAVAAFRAPRWWESFLWLLPVYLIPVNTKMFTTDWDGPRAVLVVAFAGLSTAALHYRALLPVAALAPFLLIPTWGHVQNYPRLHSPELREAAEWARTSTPKDAVFLFAGFAKSNVAGIFRADAGRALYVDWKGGGQVNLLKQFAVEWWARWQAAAPERYDPRKDYGALGIDFVVIPQAKLPPAANPAFRNGTYAVVSAASTRPAYLP